MKGAVIRGAMLALVLALATAAWAAEAPTLGVVDMDRVAAEYRLMQELNQQFQDFQRLQEMQLQERHKTRLLTEAEKQEYTDLTSAAAPTEGNKARLKELEGLSESREQRLTELRQKQERTAEEEAELKQWSPLYEQRVGEMASLQEELQASRLAKYEALSKQVADGVNNAIKVVAEAQKLAVVLRKESVLHGGEDITEAVLLKLNGSAEQRY